MPFNIVTILPVNVVGSAGSKICQALGQFGGKVNVLYHEYFCKNCKKYLRGVILLFKSSELLGSNLNYERAEDIAFLFKPEFYFSPSNKAIEKT